MHDETIIQHNPTVLFSKLDNEYLALDAEAGFCYSLNLVSGRIWQLIAEPTTLGALCAQLCHEFTVDAATCQRDLKAVLTKLASAGLVTIHAPESA